MFNLNEPIIITQSGNKFELSNMSLDFERKSVNILCVIKDGTGSVIKSQAISKTGQDFIDWYNQTYTTHASVVEALAEELGLVGNYEEEIYV